MTRRLTPQSTLDNLKREAKRWLKALRSQDSDARARLERAHPKPPAEPTLRDVQLALAREHGFAGWSELKNKLAAQSAAAVDGENQARLVHQFLEYACPDHHVRGRPSHSIAQGAAKRILEKHPEIARANFYTAIVCGEIEYVEHLLRESPELAGTRSSEVAEDRSGVGNISDLFKEITPKGWEPLLYLSFTRLPLDKCVDNAMAIARLLLDHGADPNVHFMAGGSEYTPLVGVIGEGEEDRPAHPHRDELARLLLEHGAKPFDLQVVYNIHFHGQILWFMKLMYEFSVKAGRQADWDDPEWHMLDMGGYGTGARWHLWLAVQKNDPELAEWCLTHGANPNSGPPDAQMLPQSSLYEHAIRLGHAEMAELLVRHGATRVDVAVDPEARFTTACLRMDREEAARILADHPEFLQSTTTIFDAARRDRADVVAWLLDLGVPIEIEDAKKQRPLHIAASHDALAVAELLIDRGAEIDPVEQNWNNTPIDFAVYHEFPRMIDLLAKHSRDIGNLVFTGHVSRVRELLAADPQFARTISESALLFWLPDDDAKAVEIVDLLVAFGADAGFRRKDGTTAADIARKRGLYEAAAKIESIVKLEAGAKVGAGAASETLPDLDHAKVARFEKLANDLIVAFDTGNAAALGRLNQHYGQSLTFEDLRAERWRRVYEVRHAGGGPGALSIGEARLILARNAGFANWRDFLGSVSKGTPPPGLPYFIHNKVDRGLDRTKDKAGPRRRLSPDEWDILIGEMKEHGITRLDANGLMTDAALARVAELGQVTRLDLGGSRELSDDGLKYLARMPQLEELSLNEYPGGKLTDRGLEVLRHLPELRKFEMTWQSGITDRGVANLKFCEKLESVNLVGSPTGDGAIEALRGKPLLRRLETGRNVSDAGLALLHDFPRFKTWHAGNQAPPPNDDDYDPTRLLIDGPFTNQGLASLAGLDGVYALDLFWHVTGITTDGFDVLARLGHLESLGCDGKLSDDRTMQIIGSIPGLRKLRAQGSVATDDGFIALSRSESLEKFWGREAPNLTGRGFIAFSKMPSLRALGISCKNVDDAVLASLPQFPALRELTPIDFVDAGFRHVGRCVGLERLSCMYCRDTTDMATEYIRNLTIKRYYAGKTKITDRSLEILGGMNSIERVEFWECAGITDAGLSFLAALPNLREAEFGAVPQVTLAGLAVFPPRVRVDYWA
jgi:ankyrin repeat protein